MSDVIDFLEKMGQDSALRYAPRAQLAAAVSSAGFSPQLQAALLSADQRAVARNLDADTIVCLMINVPQQEEEEEAVPHEPRSLESLLGSDNVCCLINAPIEEKVPREPRSLESVLGADNVCCMIYAPTEESEDERIAKALSPGGNVCCMVYAPMEESEDERTAKALPPGSNVCCMVFAPIEEQEQPQEPQERRVAAA